MASGTYIGQAQIEVQIVDDDYAVGDIVVWKTQKDRVDATRYLVEGFDGDRAILTLLDRSTWRPRADWFVKRDEVYERCPKCGRWGSCYLHDEEVSA